MANTGDNYGAVLEALNDKMDRDVENRHSGVETVVEHWHEGTEWYRVWSDGWIEQGGHINYHTSGLTTISFHKAFSNLNYNIQITISTTGTYGSTASTWYDAAINKTSTNFQVFGDATTNLGDKDWYACGY